MHRETKKARGRVGLVLLLAVALVAVFGMAAQQALATQTFTVCAPCHAQAATHAKHSTVTDCTKCHTNGATQAPTPVRLRELPRGSQHRGQAPGLDMRHHRLSRCAGRGDHRHRHHLPAEQGRQGQEDHQVQRRRHAGRHGRHGRELGRGDEVGQQLEADQEGIRQAGLPGRRDAVLLLGQACSRRAASARVRRSTTSSAVRRPPRRRSCSRPSELRTSRPLLGAEVRSKQCRRAGGGPGGPPPARLLYGAHARARVLVVGSACTGGHIPA